MAAPGHVSDLALVPVDPDGLAGWCETARADFGHLLAHDGEQPEPQARAGAETLVDRVASGSPPGGDRSFAYEVQMDGGVTAGLLLTLGDSPQGLRAGTLWPRRPGADEGEAAAALVAAVETEARRLGAVRLSWDLLAPDPERRHLLLERGCVVSNVNMIRDLDVSDPGPAGLDLRQMGQPVFDAYLARSVTEYAAEHVAAGSMPADRAEEMARAQLAELLPEGRLSERQHFWSAFVGAEEVGLLWLMVDPVQRYAFVYDVELAAAYRGRGLGRELMTAAHLAARGAGAARIGLHVFAHNTTALRLYQRLGYRTTAEVLARDL